MAAARNLVNLKSVGKGYGSRTVLHDVTLGVAAGERIGIVGRNGDGKSTLLRLIAGGDPQRDVVQHRATAVALADGLEVDEVARWGGHLAIILASVEGASAHGAVCDARGVDPDPVSNVPRVRVDGPARVSVRERLLVEWVAEAKVGDEIPPPWSYSRTPLYSVVRTLMLIGVIGKPDPETPLATVAIEASAAARAWLEANPPEPLADAPPPRP